MRNHVTQGEGSSSTRMGVQGEVAMQGWDAEEKGSDKRAQETENTV